MGEDGGGQLREEAAGVHETPNAGYFGRNLAIVHQGVADELLERRQLIGGTPLARRQKVERREERRLGVREGDEEEMEAMLTQWATRRGSASVTGTRHFRRLLPHLSFFVAKITSIFW